MAEFKLGRIRFVWKGSWTTATTYYIDDVVRYGGKTYICAVGHTSSADFNTDLEFSPTKWNQMSDGQEWKSDWSTSTLYKLNDIVKYGGYLYVCNDSHTSAATITLGLEADLAKWTLFVEGFDWKGNWNVLIRYKANDIVSYGGITYLCNQGHTSAATTTLGLEADQAKWDVFNAGLDYKGSWTVSNRYKVNDVVKYGGGLWICITYHTASALFATDAANWTQLVGGFTYEDEWSSSTLYQPGDIVRYGGNQYVAILNHSNAVPSTSTSNWSLFSKGFSFTSDWANTTAYKVGEVARLGGYTYLCTLDSPTISTTATASNAGTGVFTVTSTANMVVGMTVKFGGTTFGNVSSDTHYYIRSIPGGAEITLSIQPGGSLFTPTTATGSMTVTAAAKPPNSSYWTKLSGGFDWKGQWTDDVDYVLGDIVRFNSNSYVCVLAHRSESDDGSTIRPQGGGSANSRPDQDVTGTYWNVFAVGSDTSVLTTRGDLVYYGANGPTRLPIGIEGQVLRAGSDIPEWVTLGATDFEYYVAPNGIDLPAPIWGRSFDKPWKTIRYACEQVENGPRNPNAKYLLEMNRAFIQKEITEWIQYQITNNISPYTSSFDYDEYKCERDVGFIIDALIYDLGHGGNVRTRGAANSFVQGLTSGENMPYGGAGLAAEADESVAAYTYFLTVVESVLNNEAPATNYQTLNGDNSTAIVAQFIDLDVESEDVLGTITDLVEIVTDAITAGVATNIPERDSPNNLIRIATGTYRETLPIIVPEQTALLGDELRSTNAGPAGSLTHRSDTRYSLETLGRFETVVGQIILGSNVTESAGNTATQSIAFPYASTVEETDIKRLVRMMQHRIDFGVGNLHLASSTDPTGYNSSYLAGYGDARTLLKENKEFIKAEIIAYLSVNYPSIKYSRTACKRDVGYIVDAMIYDLTYGGSTQSLNAGLAYFDGPGSTLMIDSTELVATIAAYGRLKTVMQQIIANTSVTASSGNTATQWTDTTNLTTGSSANSFVGANIDIIIAILNAGSTTGRPSITVSSITGTNTLNTSSSHGLAAGDLVVSRSTANGVTVDVRYYVIAAGLTSTAFRVATSFGGSAITITNGTGLSIVFDTEDRPTATNAVTTTTALISAYTTLSAAVSTIVSNMTAFITANYGSLTYNSAKCQRDARIILDAVGYDFMFNSNFQTLKAAYAYLRSSASDVFELDQKEATRAAFSYVKTQAKANVGGDATAQARIETLMTLLDDVIFGATDEGSSCATGLRSADYALLQLERNRSYIVSELTAYIGSTYTTSVSATAATTNLITVSSTSWMQRNTAIRFTGTTVGGLVAGTTYYVQNVVSSTTFKVASVRDSNTPLTLSSASGSFTVSLYYDSALCERDVNRYLDALKYDLKYPGNYSSRMAARLYTNSVLGSLEEDMFYLRDNTGVRDMTLEGLTGDLLAPNEFGTSRVSAGAYVSLDPGWGPDDFRTWINTRSPYVQGVSTFGTAAIGQKIDGAIHNGGNDSIVSNDFTQVISDGIGAWVANNGRAELVSVFTYYAHVGYLSTGGGRIRGTNGNCSYGDFGAVAEGYDVTETPNTATVDNRFQFDAVVGSVFTDTESIFQFEYDNAGIDYTEATWTITGGGAGASVLQDELRDDGVFETRLLDLVDDSTNAPEASGNFGGFGYVTNSNTAQTGTTTSLTLAATDPEVSSAYVGMKIYLTGGTGVGQYGIISAYNSGTKIASVVKESTGASGWDHMITGTAIATPDASTTYTIEPRISFSSPTFTDVAGTMSSTGTWSNVIFGATTASYTSVYGTYTGSGTGANFTVIRNGWKYTTYIQTAGTGYERLETITIAGTSLGGQSSTNNLTITITAVSASGAILAFDTDGFGCGGRFVALRTGGTAAGSYSDNGSTWTAMTLPSSGNWTALAHGLIEDGSSVLQQSRFVAIRTGSDAAAYSDDGITWTATTMPTSTNWTSVVFGNGRFVAVNSSNATVAISLDGVAWDITGTNTGAATEITFGKNLFVTVRTGSTAAASSPDGITWTARTLPASSAWNSVTFGNNIFVAVATDSNSGAYSINGTTWTAMTVGSADGSTVAGYQEVRYGQGLFMATAYIASVQDYSYVATSENGINWTIRGLSNGGLDNAMSGYSAVAFGTPHRTGYWIAIIKDSGNHVVRIRGGATAKARAYVADEKIFKIRMTEPGSGYDTAPTVTITDPNNIYEAPTSVRKGRGVLAQPTYNARGTGYSTGSAEIDTGDGYADIYQSGSFVAVRRLTEQPVPGSNVVFDHLPDRTFKLVNVFTFLGTIDGAYTCFFQISPAFTISEAPEHLEDVTTRIRYSQVRLTGHDFLDIGTGNVVETNYPGTATQSTIPANETVESDGGRVFYTSTDQDGNFRVGGLFSIEQSTGVATLNADAFNISGLQELNLGEVTLGGGSATITEFSTDPFFTADSDTVVPTQRAIKAYIAAQIGGGGAALNVNSVTAGSIKIDSNQITNITGASIKMKAVFEFRGGVTGYPMAWNYFLN